MIPILVLKTENKVIYNKSNLNCKTFFEQFSNKLATERQQKLITSLEQRSLNSTASKSIILDTDKLVILMKHLKN